MEPEELLAHLVTAEREYREAMRVARGHGAALVRNAQQRLGLSQRAFADQLKVNHTYLSKIANGHALISRPLLGKLVRLLAGLPVDDQGGRALASG